MRKLLAVSIFALSIACVAQRNQAETPPSFVFGVHSYFDFGPPFNFYNIFVVTAIDGSHSKVESISLTPATDLCHGVADSKYQSAITNTPVSSLLGGVDPCNIPAKALAHEAKRCKHCLHFSGADVAMMASCKSGTHVLNIRELDADLFSNESHRPEHTAWTMRVEEKLFSISKDSPMDRPIFTVQSEKTSSPSTQPATPSSTLAALSRGDYDALFPVPPHLLTRLYRESLQQTSLPSIRVVSTSVIPLESPTPKWPPIALAAHVEGTLHLHAVIKTDGSLRDITVEQGPRLLTANTIEALKHWRFAPSNGEEIVKMTIQFQLNCAPVSRDSDLPK